MQNLAFLLAEIFLVETSNDEDKNGEVYRQWFVNREFHKKLSIRLYVCYFLLSTSVQLTALYIIVCLYIKERGKNHVLPKEFLQRGALIGPSRKIEPLTVHTIIET